MKYIADALTVFRIICAVIVAIAIVFFGNWALALVFAGLGALSDAFDGIAARKWKLKQGERGNEAFDEMADAALCGVLVFAPAVRLILANVNGWHDGWVPLWFIIPLLVVECFLTPFFILATSKLRPPQAFHIDLVHGVYAAGLMVGSLVLITFMAYDFDFGIAIFMTILYGITCVALAFIKTDRLTTRPGKVYHGTLTWSEFVTGRWK